MNFMSAGKKKLRVILQIVDHCNLNCRSCCAFAPLATAEYFADPVGLEKTVDRITKLAEDSLDGFGIFGGEPLLHPNIAECFKVIRKHCKNSGVFVLTNGLDLAKQPEDFWKSCRVNKIKIALTKYPIKLDFDLLERLVSENGLEPLEYWGNSAVKPKTFGKLPLDLQGRQNIADAYAGCFCRDQEGRRIIVKNGKIYPCYAITNIEYFNQAFAQNLRVVKNDYLDVFALKNLTEIFEFLSRAKPFCRYCAVSESVSAGLAWAASSRKMLEWV
jgi:MoaA/NifB/PqqE/SkfB family radical SAM enzyme